MLGNSRSVHALTSSKHSVGKMLTMDDTMSALMKERHDASAEGAGHGSRVVKAQLSEVASRLRSILLEDNAFRPWEADAVVEVVMKYLERGVRPTSDEVLRDLHSRGFPKEFASALAQTLYKRAR